MQVYDDIIFSVTLDSPCGKFEKLMGREFEMSMMGELRFFLGLLTKQTPNGTIICQTKYIKKLVNKFI